MAISTPVWAATPKVLLISPPPMTPKCFDETSGEELGSICSEKSCQLAPLYEKAAERLGCAFFDAGVKVQVSGIDGTHMEDVYKRQLQRQRPRPENPEDFGPWRW